MTNYCTPYIPGGLPPGIAPCPAGESRDPAAVRACLDAMNAAGEANQSRACQGQLAARRSLNDRLAAALAALREDLAEVDVCCGVYDPAMTDEEAQAWADCARPLIDAAIATHTASADAAESDFEQDMIAVGSAFDIGSGQVAADAKACVEAIECEGDDK